MKNKYLLCALVIFFSSCTSTEKLDKNKIIGSWKLSELTTHDKESLAMYEQMESKFESAPSSKEVVLHFYPDSSYSEVEGHKAKCGTWSYLNEKELKFGDYRLAIEEFEQEKSKNSLIVSIRNEKDNIESELRLVEEVEKLKDYKTDPFYPDNNKWRQRPTRKETNEQIRARLLNYVLHNAYILNAAHERNLNTVSFAHSKGIIKIFQGGIGVYPENNINKSWISCFYDEEDAMKAFYLFSSYLDRGVYRAESTGDWVKDDYEILMTLHSQIQERKKDNEKFTK